MRKLETTKEERAESLRLLEALPNLGYCVEPDFTARVIRDVDTAVALLQDGVLSLDPNEETAWAKAVRELLQDPPRRAGAGPQAASAQADAGVTVSVAPGKAKVDGVEVEEAPPPVAATCRDCGWKFKERADPPYSWLVVSCEPEHHLLRLFHGSLGSGAPGVPVASVAIDKVAS
jgi:hypothetical protein